MLPSLYESHVAWSARRGRVVPTLPQRVLVKGQVYRFPSWLKRLLRLGLSRDPPGGGSAPVPSVDLEAVAVSVRARR